MLAPTSPRPRVGALGVLDPRLTAGTLGVLLLLASGAHAANSVYPEPLELPILGGPTAVAALDLNEDGRLDLVANGPRLQRITVLLGSTGGVFGSEIRIDTSPRAASDLVAFDVDRDGLVDVVWVDGIRGDVVTMFQVPGVEGDVFRTETLPGTEEATSIEAVDRDGDGWTDVVVTLRGADQLVWYRNDAGTLVETDTIGTGDGPSVVKSFRDGSGPTRLSVLRTGFLSRDVAGYELGASSTFGRWLLDRPLGLTVGDLEGDGVDELLVTDGPGEVVVLEPQSNGFTARARFDVRPESPWALALAPAADADRVLVAETARGRLSLFEDEGAGFASRAAWFVSRDVAEPLFADVDRDGFREVVLPLPEEDVVLVVDPLADGYLIPDAVETGERPRRVAGTERGDPFPRVVSLAEGTDEVYVHAIVDSRLVPVQVLQGPAAADEIVLFDFDGQNGVDLLLLDAVTGLHRALTQPDGTFGPLEAIYATASARDVAVGNFLAAPGPEIALADIGIEGMRILVESTPGTWTVALESAVSQRPLFLRAKDLDLNGLDDLVVVSTTDLFTIIYMDETSVLSSSTFTTSLSPRDVGFGNFNNDAWPDIVVASAGTSTFTLYSTIFRGFYAVTDASNSAPLGAQNAFVTDITGDGVDDILMGSPSSTSVSVHNVLAPQGIVVDTAQFLRVCEQPVEFTMMHLDDDDVRDLVAVDRESDVVVTVRSDPFALLPTITGTLQSTLVGGEAQLQVNADARVVDEFAVRRLLDGRPVPMRFVQAGQWEGVDPDPPSVDAVYVLRDARGDELDRATTTEPGSATAVEGIGDAALVLPPVLNGRTVELRFRTGGNRLPVARVHDVRGRNVGRAEVVSTGNGWYEGRWDGRDLRGRRLAAGRYFVRIESPDARLSAPVTLR